MDVKVHILFLLSTYVLLVQSCSRRHSVELGSRYARYGGKYSYRHDNGWKSHIEGGTDLKGGYGVGVGVEIPLRKREAKWDGDKYDVTIRLDPCFFPSYDLDRNGVFAKEELLTIFGNNEKADALFASLDAEPGDGVITEEEFYTKAPQIIADCFNKE